MLNWLVIVGPIFGPALLVFVIYAAAKYGVWNTKREPCIDTDDARPYDAHKIAWRR